MCGCGLASSAAIARATSSAATGEVLPSPNGSEWAQRGMDNVGAWILGRNMFGPVRGPWPDYSWKGWWGDEPPYHVPTIRADAPPAPAGRNEGWHNLSLCHGRDSFCTAACERGC